ncbi:MAG: type II secretion system protein GspN [Myxococcota bacterium]
MESGSGSRRSRPVRVVWIAAAGFLLVAFFIYLGFPYDRLADVVAAEASQSTPIQLRIAGMGPRLGLAGPGIELTGVRATWEGETLMLDYARLRPAWSLAWLRGQPVVHAEVAGPMGDGWGTVGTDGRWKADLRDVDLARMPLGRLWPGSDLTGRADASLDLRRVEEGVQGALTFEARDGSLAAPGLPVAIPYDRLSGELEIGGDALVSVKAFQLEGPLVSAELSGSIGRARSFQAAPLRLQLRLTADPSLRAPLEQAGLRIGRDGSARLHISGTPSRPLVR